MNHEQLVKEWLDECQSKMIIRVWRKQQRAYRVLLAEHGNADAPQVREALAKMNGQSTVLFAWIASWLMSKGIRPDAEFNNTVRSMLEYMSSKYFPYVD